MNSRSGFARLESPHFLKVISWLWFEEGEIAIAFRLDWTGRADEWLSFPRTGRATANATDDLNCQAGDEVEGEFGPLPNASERGGTGQAKWEQSWNRVRSFAARSP